MENEEDRLRSFDRLALLRIGGSGYKMGLQHGSLLREPIRHGVLPRFGRYTEYAPLLRGLPPEQGRPEAEGFYRQVLDLREEAADPLCALNPLVLHSAEKRLSEPFVQGDVDATAVSFSLQSGWE